MPASGGWVRGDQAVDAASVPVGQTTDVFLACAVGTTDRYVSAKHRPEDFERLNRAFASARDTGPAVLDELDPAGIEANE